MLVQVGGGEVCGLTTGAKALFCFTAETMLAGEKEKIPEELLQLEGRLVEEAIVGLDGTTRTRQEERALIQMEIHNKQILLVLDEASPFQLVPGVFPSQNT